MGRKCSVVWNRESCKSGFGSDTSNTKVISFPTDFEERKSWCQNIPMPLNPEQVTEHMGVCMRHWPEVHKTKKGRGGHERQDEPPSLFGDTPIFYFVQTASERDRNVAKRRVSTRARQQLTNPVNDDEIKSWDDFANYAATLLYSISKTEECIRLVCLTDDPMIIEFSIKVDKCFRVTAHRRSTAVNDRHLINGFTWKLEPYSQLTYYFVFVRILS